MGKPLDRFQKFKNPAARNSCGYHILNFGSRRTAAADSSFRQKEAVGLRPRKAHSFWDVVGKLFDQFQKFENPAARNSCGYHVLDLAAVGPRPRTAAADNRRPSDSGRRERAVFWTLWASCLTNFKNSKTQQLGIPAAITY